MSQTEDDAREGARKLADAARDGVGAYADSSRRAGADTLHTVAEAVEAAADKIEETSPELARFTREAAAATDRLSRTVRERSVGEMGGAIADFARREPIAFFGAALLAGFAATRFLATSSRSGMDDHGASGSYGARDGATGRTGYGPGSGVAAGADRYPAGQPPYRGGPADPASGTATNPELARHTAGGAGLKH